MASTPALVSIEDIVTEFLLGYKKTTEDYFTYLHHACACVRDFRLYHSNEVVYYKATVTSNKWIDMPTDMIGFVDLVTPIVGEWWSFTEKRTIVDTTTFTGLVEGRDEDFGEGVDIASLRTTGYAAAGGINDYNYTINWEARGIFLEGISSGTVLLMYTSSGIEIGATTTVSDFIRPVIENYLLWKETFWIPELKREMLIREKNYDKEVSKARMFINSMSYNRWRDLILSTSRQAPSR